MYVDVALHKNTEIHNYSLLIVCASKYVEDILLLILVHCKFRPSYLKTPDWKDLILRKRHWGFTLSKCMLYSVHFG